MSLNKTYRRTEFVLSQKDISNPIQTNVAGRQLIHQASKTYDVLFTKNSKSYISDSLMCIGLYTLETDSMLCTGSGEYWFEISLVAAESEDISVIRSTS